MAVDADRMLKTIREAAMLLRATTGRRGMVIHLPKETADFVVAGDLHGNLTNLRSILAIADLDNHPHRHLILQEFVHGTARYPNGGCTSHRLLDAVSLLKTRYPQRVHLLLGNHELSQWTGRKVAKDDVYLNDLFEVGIEAAYGERVEEFTEAYDLLFSSMPLAVRTQNRVFMSHSIPESRHLPAFDYGVFERFGVGDDDLGKNSPVYQLVWGRDTRDETAAEFCRHVEADYLVTGHIPQEKGYAMPNSRQMIIDCVATPAACMLLPANRPVTTDEFIAGIRELPAT
ncbi:metallophosphoesterase [bacterium]|nr:metallophosphoesterase [bacterium]